MTGLPQGDSQKPEWWVVAWRWCVAKRRQFLGLLFLALAIGATALIATVDITKDGGSTVALLLVVIAALLQGASAFTFSGVGKADPTLARSTVRRLFQLTQRAAAARRVAQTAYESGLADTERRQLLGQLGVALSFIEEGVGGAAEDWAEFHPDAAKRLSESRRVADRSGSAEAVGSFETLGEASAQEEN